MSNYKVKVNNEAESREVQELFFELGYTWGGKGMVVGYTNYRIIHAWDDGKLTKCNKEFFDFSEFKELTIQQLKDLVVLKRNSIDDATHTDQDDWKWYIGADSYVWGAGNASQLQQWDKSSLDHVELNPIIKPLKEYLRINNDGKYVLETTSEREAQEPHAKHWIEVPEGCDYLVSVFGANSFIEKSMIDKIKSNKSFKNVLWQRDKDEVMKEYLVPQDNGKYALTKATEKHVSDWVEVPESKNVAYIHSHKKYVYFLDKPLHFTNHQCVWQRHTQPEELPFVDDESKSLNDTYAEIEQVRQDSVNNPQHYNKGGVECIDAIEASMTPEAFKGYLKGNIQKYMWRYEHKGGKESLQKAQWYLNKLITKVAEKDSMF